ncbi:MAG: phosphoribosylformylglycinamidine synthase I [Anaerolineales bacterium]
MKPKALILQAYGTNRDYDVAEALALAGAEAVPVPLNDLRAGKQRFRDFQMLVLPGGFSYADALGAGKLLAIDLSAYFIDEINRFVESGKPVIGICNGFQALIKSGVLPFGKDDRKEERRKKTATLTFNAGGHFECRWVTLKAVSQKCIWTKGLETLIECPIAHGEGNFQVNPVFDLPEFAANGQVALVYARPDGSPAAAGYPENPNGSIHDIAGICNPQGNVLGLMPHPENHIHPFQHPNWTRGVSCHSGLALFENGVKYVQDIN